MRLETGRASRALPLVASVAALQRQSDAAAMARVAEGDTSAFTLLVRRHSPALYRVGMRMLGDSHEAEDVVQECFVRLWQQAPRWRASGAGLVGWLYRAAMNLCFDRFRKFRVVTADSLPELADGALLADGLIEADEARHAVIRALADLPERYRAALVLCYYEGLSNALAAEVLELNVKAMESLLFRARKQLRELLEARQFTPRDLLSCYAERAA